MPQDIHYQLFCDSQLLAAGTVQAPFAIGRQSESGEPDPVSVIDYSDHQDSPWTRGLLCKLIVVSLSDRSVPRLFLRVDLDQHGHITAKNIHRTYEFQLPDAESVKINRRVNLGYSGKLCFAQRYTLQLTTERTGPPSTQAIQPREVTQSFAPLDFQTQDKESAQQQTYLLSILSSKQPASQQEVAIRMVRTALEAFKEPPGSDQFFNAAGAAAIKMIDLDRVAVLHKHGQEWVCRTQAFRDKTDPQRAAGRNFSQTLLNKMEAAGKTMIMEPDASAFQLAQSMVDVDRAVASPIFDKSQTIVGALYGDRAIGGTETDHPIGELEAAMLDVLATGISASLALEHEQRLRSSMSQFFSPVVLAQLDSDQELLNSREANVTVLFCDIRGFSSVTEKIGPTKTIDWINDILTTLSECVLAHDGVLVDYVGDELMAMWGAPANQPDHADRACQAALDMLTQIIPLGEKWRDVVPNRFGFGIGINSGLASVGNTGSKKKFKYGPLGNTVNVASRVQGVTKQIGVPGLITGDTLAAVQSQGYQTRRLTRARVVGIEKGVDLYQLCESPDDRDLCQRYEQALTAFEARDLKTAAGSLASLVQDYPEDRPTIILLSRTVEQLSRPDDQFDPVWNLLHK